MDDTCLPEQGIPPSSRTLLLSLMDLAWINTADAPLVKALFCDELADSVSSETDPFLLEWINEHMFQEFQDVFVTSGDSLSSVTFPLPIMHMHRLNDDDDVVIDFMTSLSTGKVEACAAMCPLFKLSQVLMKVQNSNDLSEIDALLGCPMMLIQPEHYVGFGNLDSWVKDTVCNSLFLAVNWVREVLNAFVSQPSLDMQSLVHHRLVLLTTLEDFLAVCLADHPGYKPLPAVFQELSVDVQKRRGAKRASDDSKKMEVKKKASEKGIKKVRRKGAKVNEKDSADSSGSSEEEAAPAKMADISQPAERHTEDGERAEPGRKVLDMVVFRCNLRELDMEIFKLFNVKLLLKDLDTDLHTMQKTTQAIQPTQLCFLLRDLFAKLTRLVGPAKSNPFGSSAPVKNSGFSCLLQKPPHKVIAYVVQLTDGLCSHLETALTFFQSKADEYDGVYGERIINCGPQRDIDLVMSFDLLLKVFTMTLRWSGFHRQEHRNLLQKFLRVFAGRVDNVSQSSMDTLVLDAFEYFSKCTALIPLINIVVSVVNLLCEIRHFVELPSLKSKLEQRISEICLTALGRIWTDDEKKPIKAEHLTVLLSTHLVMSEDSYAALHSLTFTRLAKLRILLESDQAESATK